VAEDLVSEIFMKAHRAYESFDEKVSKSAWIYRIAHNHLANHYRDRKQDVDLEDVALTLAGEDGNKTMERQETAVILQKALEQLNPEERRVVTMKYLEGYTYEEMAPILGKAADALKVATFRAMKKLKTLCISSKQN
jgi:RNA polymerase sigma-70 factor (ECF subfamily)